MTQVRSFEAKAYRGTPYCDTNTISRARDRRCRHRCRECRSELRAKCTGTCARRCALAHVVANIVPFTIGIATQPSIMGRQGEYLERLTVYDSGIEEKIRFMVRAAGMTGILVSGQG